jgi:hypothetical protein
MIFPTGLSKKFLHRIKTITPFQLFVIITVSFLFIFIVKYFSIKREWRTIQVEVIGKNWSENYNPYGYRTPFWLSEKIHVGQVERNSSGRIIAKLIDVQDYERGGEEDEAYLTLKVETIHNRKPDKYIFKDKSLDLGSAIELNLDNVLIVGQIIDNNYPESGYPTKSILITGRSYNLEPWVISQMTPGIKMVNRINDQAIAEVISVDVQEPTWDAFNLLPGGSLTVNHNSRLKDIIVKAKITVTNRDGRWYFGGHQNIKIGNPVYIYTPQINIYGLNIESIQGL